MPGQEDISKEMGTA
jgi:hypothetical protein